MATYKKDYIKIENLSQYLIPKIKELHPDHPGHTPYWANQKKLCIEGFWGKEFGQYRYCPGRLYFYGNFCTIIIVNEEEKTRTKSKPDIRDIEWERAYMLLEAEGFSGWTEDDEYTSCSKWFEYNETGVPDTSDLNINNDKEAKKLRLILSLVNKDGGLKKYKDPRENIRQLHNKPLGNPLYYNGAHNIIELGCLSKDVEVQLHKGGTKKAIDIKVGDRLVGPDSTPRVVKNLVRGEGIMYDVSSRYGDTYRLTDSHVHCVKKHKISPKRGHYQENLNLDINEILDINEDTLSRQYETIIQEVFYEEQEQKFDPYFIGYWLGDGFKREKLICYNEDDRSIIEQWLINYANSEPNRFTYTIKEHGAEGMGTKLMFRFRLTDSTMLYKNNYWANTFRNNKHIPDNYLYASKIQRLKLLAGFIDSDGSYDRTRFKVYQSDLKLIKQLQSLSRSLGFKTSLHSRIGGINNNLCYYIQVTGDIHTIPTLYPRKQACKPKTQGSRKNHINIDLNTGKVEPFYGFEVDKDNLFLLGDYSITHNARGGGKSFWYSLAVCKYAIAFNGAKYYTEDSIKKPAKAEVCVGAGQKNKSSEFCNKIEDSMQELAINPLLGAWGKLGDEDYAPSVFYMDMAGTLNPNNKDNLWRHEYKVLESGREVPQGTGSYVAHVVYSTQKREGAEAAAGGRYNKLIYEEIGLLELLLNAWGSNNSTVSVGGVQFGNQIGLGTSGNMETIQSAKMVFTHPKTYNVLSYNDDWEQSGDIAFFLPVYMTAPEYKDRNGNTNFEEAFAFYEAGEIEAAKADNPHVLASFKMNNPMVPSDMWQTDKSHILPVNEAEAREKQLLRGKLYQRLGTPIELFWDSTKQYGVDYKVDHKANPFYEPKYRYQRDDLSGAVMIYEWPEFVRGEIPNDMYKFVGHDPYVSDNMDEGDSLGVSYILTNPKYVPQGYKGNCIAASYIGKPPGGRKQYYQNLEKLLALYGNPIRGLWFEANKGDECKNYFMNKNKTDLLCHRPTKVGSTNIYQTRITQYGFIVGNKIAKIDLLDKFADWLLEPTEIEEDIKLNIERIPCIFLIRQIASYSLEKGNFDAVSAMLGCILGLREEEFNLIQELAAKNKPNRLGFLSTNGNMFKNSLSTRLQKLNNEEEFVPNPKL